LASEFPDFPVSPELHNHDNCLANVEHSDLYVLIINDRYGSTYQGERYQLHPIPEQPDRAVSITWYEYLRAVATERKIIILVRQQIWNQMPVFKAAWKRLDRSVTDELAKDVNVSPEEFDFLEYVLAQKRRNWLQTFVDLPHAREVLSTQLAAAQAEDRSDFVQEVRSLLALSGYRCSQNQPGISSNDPYFVAERGDRYANMQVSVYCSFEPRGHLVAQHDVAEFFRHFKESGLDRALVVTNTAFHSSVIQPSKVSLVTKWNLLDGLIDFSRYTEAVLHDYDHYSPAMASRSLPLRCDLKKYFIPLACDGDYKGDLFACIDEFLSDPDVNHLTILGDFGTGKSSSMMELTARLLSGRGLARQHDRIPLFFSLRDFIYVESLQSLITKGLNERYGVPPFTYQAFRRLLEDGRLLLIFDAFDEMATLSERWATLESLRRLNEAVHPRGKMILTCRTHYFTSDSHVREQIQGSLPNTGGELFAEVGGRRNFAIVNLQPFDDQQIREFLSRHDPGQASVCLREIERLPGLNDLATRPVLLEMILKTLPELMNRSGPINVATLYRHFTNLWLTTVAKGGATLTGEEKLHFTEALAIRLYSSGLSRIHHRDLAQYIADYFKTRIYSFAENALLDQEIRTCDFLNHDHEGNYQFVHRSFMEFFIAQKIAHLVADDVRTDPLVRDIECSPEVCSLVAQFISEDVLALNNLCLWGFERTGTLAWNAIMVLPFLKAFKPEIVAEQLVLLSKGQQLRSGITWVLGELGVKSPAVIKLLRKALRNSNDHSTWWEAAFALEKLGEVQDPIRVLIDSLPADWTYRKASSYLGRVAKAAQGSHAQLDQRAIIAVVKEHRAATRAGRRQIEIGVRERFGDIQFATDSFGRRAYYAVWLTGELRMRTMLHSLLPAAGHPQVSVRNMLAEAIGKIGSKPRLPLHVNQEVLPVLRGLLQDRYFRTRLHAAEAICKLHAVSLLPDLKSALRREWLRDVQEAISKSIAGVENPER